MREPMRLQKFGLPLLLFIAVGCDTLPGTEVLDSFEPGAAKEEVLALIPHGGIVAADAMEAPQLMQGYWSERYFVDGGTVEVVWLHNVDEGYPEDDFREKLNPVIFREGVLDGWGWEHFDVRKEEWLLVERMPGTEGVSYPVEPVPFEIPRSQDAIPADSAPLTLPKGDGSGTGTTA